jgi:hypothetical protein
VTESEELLKSVVALGKPFQQITELLSKFVPLTLRENPVEPWAATCGLIDEMVAFVWPRKSTANARNNAIHKVLFRIASI